MMKYCFNTIELFSFVLPALPEKLNTRLNDTNYLFYSTCI